MRFVDAVALDQSSVRITKGGSYLVADARVARVGIQTYGAHELGLKDRAASDVIRVYRSPEEVFAKDALGSMAHQPMTNDHPADMVDSTNWKELSIGMIGDGAAREVAQDGEYVRVSLAMMDQKAIDAWKNGKRELSVGYTCDVDFTPGTTSDGQAYDAVQRNIRTNHLALVKYGRAGSACRIGDSWGDQEAAPVSMKDSTMTLKTIIVDGLSVETTDAAEKAILKLQGECAAMKDAATKAEAAHATALGAKDEQIGKLDAENATLKTQVLTGDALDKAIVARTKLIGDAKKIAGDTLATDGKSDADIKKAAVLAKLGDSYAGRDATFFDHAFELQLANVGDSGGGNPLADAIRTGAGQPVGDAKTKADDAWKKQGDDLNAWRKAS